MKNQESIPSSPTKKSVLGRILFFAVGIMFDEALLRAVTIQSFSLHFLTPCVFAFFLGALFSLPGLFFKNRLRGWVDALLLFVVALYANIQLIFHDIFGSFMELVLVGMGGDAVTSFLKETFDSIFRNLHFCLLLLLPVILYVIVYRKRKLTHDKCPGKTRFFAFLAALILYGLFVLSILGVDIDDFSAWRYYYGSAAEVGLSVERIGMMPTATAELRFMVFSLFRHESFELMPEDASPYSEEEIHEAEEDIVGDGMNLSEKPQIFKGLDFSSLHAQDEDIEEINEYLATLEGTPENKYTGYFKDQNLITICAESFSPYLISRELTPTLYKLSHQGFVFENFYGTFPNTTTDGEYAFCTGLFPDLSRVKNDSSMKASAANYLPFTLGNALSSIGYQTFAYHNYLGSFYSRDVTHPNMGYACKFMDDGMTFTTSWPSSDYEMMEQSVGDYLSLDRFHAYYMTYSGHYQYEFDLNPMSERNRALVEDLPYSDTVKAYIACNMELEKALTYLLAELRATGHYRDTVIVLSNDHYPYGLDEEQYNELAGHEVDTAFEKYKNTFICWSGKMERPVKVKSYCSTVDILPTILNLFDVDYDSRLLAGRDVLSDSMHVAILKNRSFLSELLAFDSATGEVTYFVEEDKVPEWYLDAVNEEIERRLALSQRILDTDYYRYLYDVLAGKAS